MTLTLLKAKLHRIRVTEACLDYIRPLIMGEPELTFVDGLPEQLIIER